MKIRTSVLVWIFSITLPALLATAGWPNVPLAPRTASAQPPTTDVRTQRARELFIEGVEAFDQKRYEDARTAFLQAYALKRHPAVLLNIGQCELRLGRPVTGGNHLQRFLREHKSATEAQTKAAKEGISEARRRTGYIVVIVDTDEATVTIDGQSQGRSPLLDPVFVKPGKHKVTASHGGRSISKNVDARRGTATPVTINLQKPAVTGPPPVTPVPPPVYPTPSPTEPVPPYSPGPPGTEPGPPIGPGPDTGDTGGRENFFKWFKRKPGAWVATGFAGLGLVGMVGFSIGAGIANANITHVESEIQKESDNPHDPAGIVPEGQKPCGDVDDPAGDRSYYHETCDQLRDNMKAYDIDVALAVTSAVVLVAGVTSTLVYYFVDTRKGNKTADNTQSPSIAVVPVIAPTQQGLGIIRTF